MKKIIDFYYIITLREYQVLIYLLSTYIHSVEVLSHVSAHGRKRIGESITRAQAPTPGVVPEARGSVLHK